MRNILNVVRLHTNKRQMFFAVPLFILAVGAVISIVIVLTIQRFGGDPGTADYIEGARSNGGLVWSVGGFFGYLGVQAVSLTFPFALALGTTRRAFVLGTALANALLAAYVTAVLAALFLIEQATNHWGMGLYLTDVMWFGSGHLGWLIVIAFLLFFGLLSVGGLFAASWVRFGSKGSIGLALAIALVLALVLLVFAPQIPELLMGYRAWMGVTAGVAVSALSVLGTWLLMRRASVR